MGESTVVNTQNATIGNAFTETQVRQLPLQTRNVVELLSLQPGVTSTGEVIGISFRLMCRKSVRKPPFGLELVVNAAR